MKNNYSSIEQHQASTVNAKFNINKQIDKF